MAEKYKIEPAIINKDQSQQKHDEQRAKVEKFVEELIKVAEKYKKIEDKFRGKVWTELKHYRLEVVSNNGETIYRYGNLIIDEKSSMNNEFYSLSTKEVMNVCDYYGVLSKLKKIVIHNYQLKNLNGFDDVSDPKGDSLNLFKPIELKDRQNIGVWKWRENFPERWQALFTLLHELGHILGYKTQNIMLRAEMENRADQFAKNEIDKFWGKLIRE